MISNKVRSSIGMKLSINMTQTKRKSMLRVTKFKFKKYFKMGVQLIKMLRLKINQLSKKHYHSRINSKTFMIRSNIQEKYLNKWEITTKNSQNSGFIKRVNHYTSTCTQSSRVSTPLARPSLEDWTKKMSFLSVIAR